MKAEYRDAWVAALRSGEYAQGRCYLNSNGAYCCLGVLADLAIKNNWFPDLDIKWLYENKCQKLSVRSSTFVGSLHCSLTDALCLSDDLQDIFVRLNDNDCFSFNEIADYIETNLKDI